MDYSVSEQLSYLDDAFARIWDAVNGLVRDQAVDGIFRTLPAEVLPIGYSVADLTRAPRISAAGGTVRLRIPGHAAHSLALWLAHDIWARADFALDISLAANGAPTVDPHIVAGVDLPAYWDVLAAALGVVSFGGLAVTAAAIPTIIQEVFEEFIRAKLGGGSSELTSSLDTLATLTFDHAAPYQPDDVTMSPVGGHELGTHLGSEALDWIDLVLVADNYPPDAAAATEFESQTSEIVRVLRDPIRIDNARLRAMGSLFRYWRLPLTGTAPNELITTSVSLSPSAAANSTFNNLSRLAETGLRITETLARDRAGQTPKTRPVMVILRRTDGAELPRAIALGDTVILPISEGASGQLAASTLVHELGHVLGGLADEYTTDQSEDDYFGPEPEALNVTKDSSGQKWHSHLGASPLASSDPAYTVGQSGWSGAYDFQGGVYRPAERCKMRHWDEDAAFCPVCEQALAVGILQRFRWFDPGVQAPLTIEVEYVSPWRTRPQRYTVAAPLLGGVRSAGVALEATARNESMVPTRVRVSVSHTAVPDHVCKLTAHPGGIATSTYVDVVRGDLLQIDVTPEPSSPLPAGIRGALSQGMILSFSESPSLNLSPPTGLRQSPGVGSKIYRTYDPITGAQEGVEEEVVISASSGAGENLDQDTDTVFVLFREDQLLYEIPLPDPSGVSTEQSYSFRNLRHGRYRWEVFSRLRLTTLESNRVTMPSSDGFHFEVCAKAAAFDDLPKPIGLLMTDWGGTPTQLIVPSSSGPQPAVQSRRAVHAAGHHPAGDPIHFEFEVRDPADRFTGGDTVLLGPYSPQASDTLQVSARLDLDHPGLPSTVPLDGDVKFRVRTHAEGGLSSPWSTYKPPAPLPPQPLRPVPRILGVRGRP